MQYNGFISTLIDRSEDLLPLDEPNGRNVTMLLLVLSTGFALVHDRIRFWNDDDDLKLRVKDPWGKVRKSWDSKLNDHILIEDQKYFQEFRTSRDWCYYRIPEAMPSKKFSVKGLAKYLSDDHKLNLETLTLYDILSALRNSFAHGGVLPMSPQQLGEHGINRRTISAKLRYHSEEIDRVYFVSRWTKTLSQSCGHETHPTVGLIVMEFGLAALRNFWEDWKALILIPGKRALKDLDRAA